MSNVLTLNEVKQFLRVTTTTDDTLIQSLMDAAEEYVERAYSIKLSEQSISEHLDGGTVSLVPSWGPVISVTSVTDAETGTVEDTDNYYLRFNSEIVRDGDNRWYDGRGRWLVEYTAGYGGSGASSIALPDGLRTALLHLVRRAYDARGAVKGEGASGWSVSWDGLMSGDVALLLAPYRRMGV